MGRPNRLGRGLMAKVVPGVGLTPWPGLSLSSPFLNVECLVSKWMEAQVPKKAP